MRGGEEQVEQGTGIQGVWKNEHPASREGCLHD